MKTIFTFIMFACCSVIAHAQIMTPTDTNSTTCDELRSETMYNASGSNSLESNPSQDQKNIFTLNLKNERLSFKHATTNRYEYGDAGEKFRQIRNAGGWTILGGGIVTTIGVAMVLENLDGQNEQRLNTGIDLWVGGDAIQLAGIILNIVGRIGYHHAKGHAFQFQSTGHTVGLVYTLGKKSH